MLLENLAGVHQYLCLGDEQIYTQILLIIYVLIETKPIVYLIKYIFKSSY